MIANGSESVIANGFDREIVNGFLSSELHSEMGPLVELWIDSVRLDLSEPRLDLVSDCFNSSSCELDEPDRVVLSWVYPLGWWSAENKTKLSFR